jgi:hypothetical protein
MDDKEMIEVIYEYISPYVDDDDVDLRCVLACALSEINDIMRDRRKKTEAYHEWYIKTHD